MLIGTIKCNSVVVLVLMALRIAKQKGTLSNTNYHQIITQLQLIPDKIERVLEKNPQIKQIAKQFKHATNFLYLGRGYNFPVALEGALKLKEISYIHASAYHSGELKHGPLALVDKKMPVVCFLPDNHLAKLVLSNLAEVEARQGQTFIFTNKKIPKKNKKVEIIKMPDCPDLIAPILYIIPAQLLSYHVALKKKTDVDKPRNLAKSVTVE